MYTAPAAYRGECQSEQQRLSSAGGDWKKSARRPNFCWDNGADPNKASGYNPLPLSLAAQAGNVEAARLLLLHGADVNGRGHLPHTPLYFARKHKQAEMIALLQKAGGKE